MTDDTLRGKMGISRWPILSVLMLAELTSCMEAAMTYAALPTFYKIFGDPIMIGWLYTAFLLVAGAAAGLCGALGDRFGRRPVLVWALALAALGSLVSMLAPNLGWIIAGRALQGVSLAVLPLTIGLIREHIPDREVPVAVGMLTIMATAAGGACYLLGGLLVDYFSWRWIFGVTTVVTLLSIWGILYVVPHCREDVAGQGKIDWLGGILFVPGVVALLLAVSRAPFRGWTDPAILMVAAVGIIILAFWMRRELTHKSPLIDIRLMLNRRIAITLIIYGLIALGPMQFGMTLFLLLQEPEWTGSGFGLTATFAGVLNLPGAVAGCFGAPWGGKFARKHGARSALIVSLVVLGSGWFIVILAGKMLVVLVGAIIVINFGASMLFTSISNLLIESTPLDRTSEVLGIAEVVRAMWMAVGSQMMVVIFASSIVSRPEGGSFPSADAHEVTFWLTLLFCVGSFFLALLIPSRAKNSAVYP